MDVERLRRYALLFNAHDWDGVAALCSPSMLFDDRRRRGITVGPVERSSRRDLDQRSLEEERARWHPADRDDPRLDECGELRSASSIAT